MKNNIWHIGSGAEKRRGRTDRSVNLVSRPELPFDMPTRAALAASSKKVFAHYFTPYPISVDNDPAGASEYWQQYWLPPGANEGGTNHAAYGGLVRDRKIYRAPRTGDWVVLDKVDEVNQAISAGLDGFLVDVLQISPNQRWNQFMELVEAANIVNNSTFKLVPMPDGTASATASATTLADNLAGIADEPCIYRHTDGRLMIAPYMPERAPNSSGAGGAAAVQFWTDFKNRMLNTYGENIHMWMCYTNSWTAAAQAPAFDPIAFGHGRWGDRDPVSCASNSTANAGAPAHCHATYSKPWMHPVAPQDTRPNQDKYWEAHCSENFRVSWMAAINGNADWIQIPTWDDFSESAHVCPSRDSGWAWLDIGAYYLVRYKLGYWPQIIRDGLYLIHRKQPTTGVTYTGPQTSFQTRLGGTAQKDEIEVLSFLKAPADITLTVGGVPTTFNNVPAGVTSNKIALATGTVSATAVRSGVTVATVTSPHTISTTQISQDMHYKATSGLRA